MLPLSGLGLRALRSLVVTLDLDRRSHRASSIEHGVTTHPPDPSTGALLKGKWQVESKVQGPRSKVQGFAWAARHSIGSGSQRFGPQAASASTYTFHSLLPSQRRRQPLATWDTAPSAVPTGGKRASVVPADGRPMAARNTRNTRNTQHATCNTRSDAGPDRWTAQRRSQWWPRCRRSSCIIIIIIIIISTGSPTACHSTKEPALQQKKKKKKEKKEKKKKPGPR
ncbi:hypothetical protein K490DRAFT_55047 [Saccharata proteae CBS 121410]|uniref:Uncharacterized protein n=1 Tax=Saccharata proteae CBS 121410 TaxID=1314787 RepID=A0A6A5YCN6_9PEZI|nr:hypothetical protein K490DRAFT_55047 [Saccharata proteae CBS 121410]